jgi:hypothetical protein
MCVVRVVLVGAVEAALKGAKFAVGKPLSGADKRLCPAGEGDRSWGWNGARDSSILMDSGGLPKEKPFGKKCYDSSTFMVAIDIEGGVIAYGKDGNFSPSTSFGIAAEGLDCVIDVGCAEGYYAVGMARRMPATRVLAFDLDLNTQRVCTELIAKNKVTDRVTVGALFKPADFAQHMVQRY